MEMKDIPKKRIGMTNFVINTNICHLQSYGKVHLKNVITICKYI